MHEERTGHYRWSNAGPRGDVDFTFITSIQARYSTDEPGDGTGPVPRAGGLEVGTEFASQGWTRPATFRAGALPRRNLMPPTSLHYRVRAALQHHRTTPSAGSAPAPSGTRCPPPAVNKASAPRRSGWPAGSRSARYHIRVPRPSESAGGLHHCVAGSIGHAASPSADRRPHCPPDAALTDVSTESWSNRHDASWRPRVASARASRRGTTMVG